MPRQPRERVFTLSSIESWLDANDDKDVVVRDRATTRDVGLRRLVTLPNPVLWRVLNYWRATS